MVFLVTPWAGVGVAVGGDLLALQRIGVGRGRLDRRAGPHRRSGHALRKGTSGRGGPAPVGLWDAKPQCGECARKGINIVARP